jgi:nitroreductase
MDIIEAMQSRKSIRGYKPVQVSKEILEKILTAATRCPSSRNIQPWEFAIVTGKTFDNIKRETVETFSSGVKPNPDIKYNETAEGRHKQNTLDSLNQIWDTMGITRDDVEARATWARMRISYFGAPAAVFIFADSYMDSMAVQFDMGLLTQSICLAALQYGLGTCVIRAPLDFPEVIRKYVNIPQSKRIVIAIILGYPDSDFPANKARTTRESLENITTWYGFD